VTAGVEGSTVYYSTDGGNEWIEGVPGLTDVGVVEFKVKATHKGYEDAISEGTYRLEVTPATITVKAEAEYKYDGTEKTLTITPADASGVVEGETLTFSTTPKDGETVEALMIKGTNAGTYTELVSEYSWSVTKNEEADTKGESTEESTEEVVPKRSLLNAFKAALLGAAEDDTADDAAADSTSTDGTAEEATETTGTASDVAGGGNSGKNYTLVIDGTLTITKRAVTLTSATDSKAYDGKALTNDEVAEGGDGFAEGEGATYEVTGTVTAPGTVTNEFTYTLNEGTLADNYDITTETGTLEVTKKAVTITADSDTKVYDGAALTKNSYTSTELAEGDKIDSVTITGTQTAVGSADNVPSEAKIVDATGEDVTENYEITYANGTLEVTKRNVTLTSASDSKEYDGTALTNGGVTVSGDGFADGEGASFNVTGSQTEVGSSANTFTYTLNEGTDAGNYNITVTEGTLTVTKKEETTRRKTSERTSGGPAPSSTPTITVTTPDATPEVMGAYREPELEQGDVLGAAREFFPAVLGASRLPQTGQLWWPVPIFFLAGLFLMFLGFERRRKEAQENGNE
jgi:hypothetical protein